MTLRADAAATLSSLVPRPRSSRSTAIERECFGVYHRLVWGPSSEALAQSPVTEQPLPAGAEAAIMVAAASARLRGGSWLLPILAQRPTQGLADPLPPGAHPIRSVVVIERPEAQIERWGGLADGLAPEVVRVQLQRPGRVSDSYRVHASRLIYVPGLRGVPLEEPEGYDLSIRDVYGDSVPALARSWGAGADLLERLSMPVLSMPDPGAAAASDGWRARMDLIRQSIRTDGLLALFGQDSIAWTGPTISGYGEVQRGLIESMCVREGIPASRLIGQAPAGLSTDDAAGARTYYDLLRRLQRHDYTPAIQRLLTIAHGPGDHTVEWPSLERPTALEQAQIDLIDAQRVEAMIRSAVIDSEEAREILGVETA